LIQACVSRTPRINPLSLMLTDLRQQVRFLQDIDDE
jgi:Fe-S-cluster formation regulator IscX/YfhJ